MHGSHPPFIIQDPIPGRLPAAVPQSYCTARCSESALSSTLFLSRVLPSPPLSSLLCQLTVGSQSQWLSASDQSLRGAQMCQQKRIQYTSDVTPQPRITTAGAVGAPQ